MTADVPTPCTFCEAVAFLAYQDEQIVGRYAIPRKPDPWTGTPASGFRLRQLERLYPHRRKGLPGWDEVDGITDQSKQAERAEQWLEADSALWAKATLTLVQAVKSKSVTAWMPEGGSSWPSRRWGGDDLERDASLVRFEMAEVRGLPAPAAAAISAPSVVPKPIKQKGGLNYRELDAALVNRMRELITHGDARGINDAARALAAEAEGKATVDNKRKRLIGAYMRAFPDEPT